MASKLTKTLSVFLCLIYFLTQVALGGLAESHVWQERRQNLKALRPPSLSSLDLNSLPKTEPIASVSPLAFLAKEIPLTHALIQETFQGKKDRTPIILIQDIHLNTEAQQNIGAVLQRLINSEQISMIGVEGAFEPFDFSRFRVFPNKTATAQIAQALLDKKMIAAPSWIGLTSTHDLPAFIGVDSRDHYTSNVNVYLTSYKIQEPTKKRLKDIEKSLSQAKERTFNTALKEFDQVQTAYREKRLGLGEYLRKLSLTSSHLAQSGKATPGMNFKIAQFLEAYEMELTLDFYQAERERAQVIERITHILTNGELFSLTSQSLEYKSGHIGFGAYHHFLKDLCESKNIRLKDFPAFDDYIRYVLLADGIHAATLMAEVRNLEKELAKSLATSPEEEKLLQQGERLNLTKKLVGFEMTPGEWEEYRKALVQSAGFRNQSFSRPEIGGLNSELKSFESFYEQADIRSHKMVENLLSSARSNPQVPSSQGKSNHQDPIPNSSINSNRWIESLKLDDWSLPKPLVLVTGGFHTPQITSLLREKRISYMVVSPKITKIKDESGTSYLSVFTREKTPLERLFENHKLSVNPSHLALGTFSPETKDVTVACLGLQELTHANSQKSRFDFTVSFGADKVPVHLTTKEPTRSGNVVEEFNLGPKTIWMVGPEQTRAEDMGLGISLTLATSLCLLLWYLPSDWYGLATASLWFAFGKIKGFRPPSYPAGMAPDVEILNPLRLLSFKLNKGGIVFTDYDLTVWNGFPEELQINALARLLTNNPNPSREQVMQVDAFVSKYSGHAMEDVAFRWKEEVGAIPNDYLEQIAKIRARIKAASLHRLTPNFLFDGTIPYLAAFQENGLRIVVLTGGVGTYRALYSEKLGINKFIPSADHLGGGRKNEKMRRVLREANVSPDRAIMIGDAAWDLMWADEIGVVKVGFAPTAEHRARLLDAKPDIIINRNYRALGKIHEAFGLGQNPIIYKFKLICLWVKMIFASTLDPLFFWAKQKLKLLSKRFRPRRISPERFEFEAQEAFLTNQVSRISHLSDELNGVSWFGRSKVRLFIREVVKLYTFPLEGALSEKRQTELATVFDRLGIDPNAEFFCTELIAAFNQVSDEAQPVKEAAQDSAVRLLLFQLAQRSPRLGEYLIVQFATRHHISHLLIADDLKSLDQNAGNTLRDLQIRLYTHLGHIAKIHHRSAEAFYYFANCNRLAGQDIAGLDARRSLATSYRKGGKYEEALTVVQNDDQIISKERKRLLYEKKQLSLTQWQSSPDLTLVGFRLSQLDQYERYLALEKGHLWLSRGKSDERSESVSVRSTALGYFYRAIECLGIPLLEKDVLATHLKAECWRHLRELTKGIECLSLDGGTTLREFIKKSPRARIELAKLLRAQRLVPLALSHLTLNRETFDPRLPFERTPSPAELLLDPSLKNIEEADRLLSLLKQDLVTYMIAQGQAAFDEGRAHDGVSQAEPLRRAQAWVGHALTFTRAHQTYQDIGILVLLALILKEQRDLNGARKLLENQVLPLISRYQAMPQNERWIQAILKKDIPHALLILQGIQKIEENAAVPPSTPQSLAWATRNPEWENQYVKHDDLNMVAASATQESAIIKEIKRSLIEKYADSVVVMELGAEKDGPSFEVLIDPTFPNLIQVLNTFENIISEQSRENNQFFRQIGSRGEPFVIACLSEARFAAIQDHSANGFIGIRKDVFDADTATLLRWIHQLDPYLPQNLIDRLANLSHEQLLHLFLQLALRHELAHESLRHERRLSPNASREVIIDLWTALKGSRDPDAVEFVAKVEEDYKRDDAQALIALMHQMDLSEKELQYHRNAIEKEFEKLVPSPFLLAIPFQQILDILLDRFLKRITEHDAKYMLWNLEIGGYRLTKKWIDEAVLLVSHHLLEKDKKAASQSRFILSLPGMAEEVPSNEGDIERTIGQQRALAERGYTKLANETNAPVELSLVDEASYVEVVKKLTKSIRDEHLNDPDEIKTVFWRFLGLSWELLAHPPLGMEQSNLHALTWGVCWECCSALAKKRYLSFSNPTIGVAQDRSITRNGKGQFNIPSGLLSEYQIPEITAAVGSYAQMRPRLLLIDELEYQFFPPWIFLALRHGGTDAYIQHLSGETERPILASKRVEAIEKSLVALQKHFPNESRATQIHYGDFLEGLYFRLIKTVVPKFPTHLLSRIYRTIEKWQNVLKLLAVSGFILWFFLQPMEAGTVYAMFFAVPLSKRLRNQLTHEKGIEHDEMVRKINSPVIRIESLRRNNFPLFTSVEAENIAALPNLKERLSILPFLAYHRYIAAMRNHRGQYLFTTKDLARIILCTRPPAEIMKMVTKFNLTETQPLGIRYGHTMADIIVSHHPTDEIIGEHGIIADLKYHGYTSYDSALISKIFLCRHLNQRAIDDRLSEIKSTFHLRSRSHITEFLVNPLPLQKIKERYFYLLNEHHITNPYELVHIIGGGQRFKKAGFGLIVLMAIAPFFALGTFFLIQTSIDYLQSVTIPWKQLVPVISAIIGVAMAGFNLVSSESNKEDWTGPSPLISKAHDYIQQFISDHAQHRLAELQKLFPRDHSRLDEFAPILTRFLNGVVQEVEEEPMQSFDLSSKVKLVRYAIHVIDLYGQLIKALFKNRKLVRKINASNGSTLHFSLDVHLDPLGYTTEEQKALAIFLIRGENVGTMLVDHLNTAKIDEIKLKAGLLAAQQSEIGLLSTMRPCSVNIEALARISPSGRLPFSVIMPEHYQLIEDYFSQHPVPIFVFKFLCKCQFGFAMRTMNYPQRKVAVFQNLSFKVITNIALRLTPAERSRLIRYLNSEKEPFVGARLAATKLIESENRFRTDGTNTVVYQTPGGRWPLFQPFYNWIELGTKTKIVKWGFPSDLASRIGRVVGQVFAPIIIESGFMVGGGSILLTWGFSLPLADGPPLFFVFALQLLWNVLHKKDMFSQGRGWTTLITLILLWAQPFYFSDSGTLVNYTVFFLNLLLPHFVLNTWPVGRFNPFFMSALMRSVELYLPYLAAFSDSTSSSLLVASIPPVTRDLQNGKSDEKRESNNTIPVEGWSIAGDQSRSSEAPTDFDNIADLVNGYLRGKQYGLALDVLTQEGQNAQDAFTLKPEFEAIPNAKILLAELLDKIGHFEAAYMFIRDFEDAKALVVKLKISFHLGNNAEVEALVQKLNSRDLSDGVVLKLSPVLCHIGRWDEGLALLRESGKTSLKPRFQDNPHAYETLAYLLTTTGELEAALNILTGDGIHIRFLLSRKPAALLLLCKLLADKGYVKEAIEVLSPDQGRSVHKFLADVPESYLRLAQCLRFNKQMDDALILIEKRLQSRPEEPILLLTWAWLKVKKDPSTWREVENLLNPKGHIRPSLKWNAGAYNLLAKMNIEMGQPETAARYLMRPENPADISLINMNPVLRFNSNSRVMLARSLFGLKRQKDAVDALSFDDGWTPYEFLSRQSKVFQFLAFLADLAGNSEKAIHLLTENGKIKTFLLWDQRIPLVLSQAHRNLENFEKAEEVLREARDRFYQVIPIRIGLERQIEHLRWFAREVTPALELRDEGKLIEAKTHLEGLLPAFESEPTFLIMIRNEIGKLEELHALNEKDRAEEEERHYFAKAEATFQRAMTKGNFAEAKRVLDSVYLLNPYQEIDGLMATQHYDLLGWTKPETVVADDPKDPPVYERRSFVHGSERYEKYFAPLWESPLTRAFLIFLSADIAHLATGQAVIPVFFFSLFCLGFAWALFEAFIHKLKIINRNVGMAPLKAHLAAMFLSPFVFTLLYGTIHVSSLGSLSFFKEFCFLGFSPPYGLIIFLFALIYAVVETWLHLRHNRRSPPKNRRSTLTIGKELLKLPHHFNETADRVKKYLRNRQYGLALDALTQEGQDSLGSFTLKSEYEEIAEAKFLLADLLDTIGYFEPAYRLIQNFDQPQALVLKLRISFHLGNITDVETFIQTLNSQENLPDEVVLKFSAVLCHLGRWDEGLGLLTEPGSNTVKPRFQSNPEALVTLASLLSTSGEPEEALKILTSNGLRIRQVVYGNPEAILLLSKLLAERGYLKEAIDLVSPDRGRSVHKSLEEIPESYLRLAQNLRFNGQIEIALELVENRLRIYPEEPATLLAWAWLKLKLEPFNWREVEDVLNPGGYIRPSLKWNEAAYNMLAKLKIETGQPEEAARHLMNPEKPNDISLGNMNPVLLFIPQSRVLLARSFYRMEHKKEAFDTLSVDNGNGRTPHLFLCRHSETFHFLALFLRKKGNSEWGINLLTENGSIKRFLSWNHNIAITLSQLYRNQEDFENAKEVLRQAQDRFYRVVLFRIEIGKRLEKLTWYANEVIPALKLRDEGQFPEALDHLQRLTVVFQDEPPLLQAVRSQILKLNRLAAIKEQNRVDQDKIELIQTAEVSFQTAMRTGNLVEAKKTLDTVYLIDRNREFDGAPAHEHYLNLRWTPPEVGDEHTLTDDSEEEIANGSQTPEYWTSEQGSSKYTHQHRREPEDFLKKTLSISGNLHDFSALGGFTAAAIALVGAAFLIISGHYLIEADFISPIICLVAIPAAWMIVPWIIYSFASFIALFLTNPETSFLRRIWEALVNPIAQSNGFRSPAFDLLPERIKRAIHVHESFSHFKGLFAMLPGLASWHYLEIQAQEKRSVFLRKLDLALFGPDNLFEKMLTKTHLTETEQDLLMWSARSDPQRLHAFGLDKLTDEEWEKHLRTRFLYLKEHLHDFDEFLARRPTITRGVFLRDCWNYYLPYAAHLIELKGKKGAQGAFVVGVSAIQGTGKTTQGEVMEIILEKLGYQAISRSIDDHYLTHAELTALRQADPRFIRRGMTHDINLAMQDLTALRDMKDGQVKLVPSYYKGAHQGDGDRYRWIQLQQGTGLACTVQTKVMIVNKELKAVSVLHLKGAFYNQTGLFLGDNMGADIPLMEKFLPDALLNFLREAIQPNSHINVTWQDGNFACFKGTIFQVGYSGPQEMRISIKDLPTGWRIVSKKPDFIFYDGWMVGARAVTNERFFESGLPALEKPESRVFARLLNQKLHQYEPLWSLIDYLVVLYVPSYEMSLQWRDQAEEPRRAQGRGMTTGEIREFVYYFWRSVHPGIHIRNLAHNAEHTQQVTIINHDHSIGGVTIPSLLTQRKKTSSAKGRSADPNAFSGFRAATAVIITSVGTALLIGFLKYIIGEDFFFLHVRSLNYLEGLCAIVPGLLSWHSLSKKSNNGIRRILLDTFPVQPLHIETIDGLSKTTVQPSNNEDRFILIESVNPADALRKVRRIIGNTETEYPAERNQTVFLVPESNEVVAQALEAESKDIRVARVNENTTVWTLLEEIELTGVERSKNFFTKTRRFYVSRESSLPPQFFDLRNAPLTAAERDRLEKTFKIHLLFWLLNLAVEMPHRPLLKIRAFLQALVST